MIEKLKQFKEWIAKMWRKTEDLTKKNTLLAIRLTEGLKKVMDSSVDDVVLAIVKAAIPGKADDVLIDKCKAYVEKHLPATILTLKMVNTIAGITDPAEQMKAILAQFKLSDDIEKNAALHSFCAKLIYCLSDGKISWSDCIYLSENGYEEFQLGVLK